MGFRVCTLGPPGSGIHFEVLLNLRTAVIGCAAVPHLDITAIHRGEAL